MAEDSHPRPGSRHPRRPPRPDANIFSERKSHADATIERANTKIAEHSVRCIESARCGGQGRTKSGRARSSEARRCVTEVDTRCSPRQTGATCQESVARANWK